MPASLDESRPSPDALLKAAEKESRGKHKIFLGAAPGVGKTYAMLQAAQVQLRRGVAVRVLVDGIGSTYSRPTITVPLEEEGVPVATFLPTAVPFYLPYANLRNHRKIMVVDGATGFTGGLNIREGCRLSRAPRHPVRDLHFRLRGPVVAQLGLGQAVQVLIERGLRGLLRA
mgnify:CR=1 FL=1